MSARISYKSVDWRVFLSKNVGFADYYVIFFTDCYFFAEKRGFILQEQFYTETPIYRKESDFFPFQNKKSRLPNSNLLLFYISLSVVTSSIDSSDD